MGFPTTQIPPPSGVGDAPFDVIAPTYDRSFSESLLGTLLRDAVHEEMAGAFEAGERVLDLGCGTGEDALRLARGGIFVHGVDRSSRMLAYARAKSQGFRATFETADLATLNLAFGDDTFDGALANFGSLNGLADRRSLAREMARVIRPGGRVFLVVMGRWCPWEWAWYAAKGQLRTAFRRIGGSAASAAAGPVYYPSPEELAADFESDFEHVRTSGIGVVLPPTYAAALVERHADLFRRLARFERRIRHNRTASRFNDHFLLELRRRERRTSVAFTCPSCGALLEPSTETSLRCTSEGTTYEMRDGIVQLLAPDRLDAFEQFVAEYDAIRSAEGRGADTPAYYRALPFRDATGRFDRDWKIRAASYRTFLRGVVEPLERTRRELRILDLGAGFGWLSYRMAKRGHEAVAVDLRSDGRDGLGAHRHFDAPFTPVIAEFDRLPFAPGSFDLVVFNAAFHYSEKYERTLAEVFRVLAEDGRVAIIDSPIYRRRLSGSSMVADRERAFTDRYGFASNSVDSEHFLTPTRLRALSGETGFTWTIHKPSYGPRWALRPLIARLRRTREPARFAVIEGRARLDVEEELDHARPSVMIRSLMRAFHRARRLMPRRAVGTRSIDAAGLRLDLDDGVFDPVMYRSGTFLAEVVRGLDLEDKSALDLGTGSGICAIVAALWGARVTATDVNPQALECAARNASTYEVDLDVRPSNLFAGLRGERFDRIFFNPPFFRGTAAHSADRAWRAPDIAERFARNLRRHLAEGGYALVVLSTDGACPDYLRTFDRAGYRLAVVARRRFGNETLTVYRVSP